MRVVALIVVLWVVVLRWIMIDGWSLKLEWNGARMCGCPWALCGWRWGGIGRN